VVGFEFRASCLLGRISTVLTTPSAQEKTFKIILWSKIWLVNPSRGLKVYWEVERHMKELSISRKDFLSGGDIFHSPRSDKRKYYLTHHQKQPCVLLLFFPPYFLLFHFPFSYNFLKLICIIFIVLRLWEESLS
jgi:hypothetical protein